MSSSHYNLNKEQGYTIRGSAKLLNAASAKYDGDWQSVPHTHNYAELFYIVSGKGQFFIENQVYPVEVDQLVIIDPHVVHTEVSLRAQPFEYIVLGIEGIALGSIGSAGEPFRILAPSGSAEIFSYLRSILWEMELKQAGYEDICQAFMEILIIRLLRNSDLAVPVKTQTMTTNRQCAAVRRYIDLHFKEPLTLDQLARETHMNKYYLAHTFKQEYGVPPINYMISRRIEESKHLLTETDFSISLIAQVLGFSSSSYFSQVFRRSQAMTPLAYRQRRQQRIPCAEG